MGDITGSSTPLPPEEIPHEIRKNVLGSSVLYSCVRCGTPLTSSLDEAGSRDACPDCGQMFVVPGTRKRNRADERKDATDAAHIAIQIDKKISKKDSVVRRTAQQAKKANALQLDRDPLREWATYTAVISVLLLFFSSRYVVAAVLTDRSGICVMIISLFGIGITLNLRGVLTLRSEYVCAAVCLSKLNEPTGLAETTNSPAAGIFHQHVNDLANIAKHDLGFSQDSLVTLIYSRLMAKSKMVEVLSGVLVSLGLIGTVIGLISMTDGLSDALEALGDDGSAGSLLSGMRATMAGLGTAFYTTLVGAMLGSVVLRVLNNVYVSNVDHLVSYIATTTEVDIVPRLKKIHRTKEALSNAVIK